MIMKTTLCILLTHVLAINGSSPYIEISCTVNNTECQISKWSEFKQCIESASSGSICETPQGNFSNIAISIKNLHGNKNKPIIIKPKADRYSTVLDGTINLNASYFKWNKYLQNECIYYTTLNESLSIWQLFVNHEMQTPARFPNGALWKDKTIFNASLALNHGDKQSTIGLMIDSTANRQQISDLNFSLTNAIAILNIFSFQTVSSKVTHHTIGSNQFNYSYFSSWLPGNHKQYNTKRYYLEGLFEFMDQETEYHLDTKHNILYSYTPNCQDPNEISFIRGKTQSFALNISDSSYINITDLIFFGTTFSFNKSNDITLENNIFKYNGYSKRLLGITDGPIPSYALVYNLSIINNTFVGSDAQPIVIQKNEAYLYNNLFEYNYYSCVTIYGSEASPGPISGSVIYAHTFMQNTVINYGPYNGYSAGKASIAEMNYFANQSNLMHDGAQIQVGPPDQPGTKLIRNWSYNTVKYGYRFDGCSANANDNTNCGHNCIISHCVSFNDQSIMIKGDNHSVLNNIGFNATMSNGNKADSSSDPAICIRHLSHNWTNNHTITMNNGADEFMINGSNNGCLYPIVGYASNNIQGPVERQLIDAPNFDFRPKPGSDYAKQYIGPYLINDTYYWIPGRKTNKVSFPIPKQNGILRYICDDNNHKYIELMWRMGYKSSFHIGKILDSKYNLIEKREFVGKENIWKIKINNHTRHHYYWSVDSIMDDTKIVFKGQLWKFHLTHECI